jgi:hypothetical protein
LHWPGVESIDIYKFLVADFLSFWCLFMTKFTVRLWAQREIILFKGSIMYRIRVNIINDVVCVSMSYLLSTVKPLNWEPRCEYFILARSRGFGACKLEVLSLFLRCAFLWQDPQARTWDDSSRVKGFFSTLSVITDSPCLEQKVNTKIFIQWKIWCC